MSLESNSDGNELRPTSKTSEASATPLQVTPHARSSHPALAVERKRLAHAPYLVLLIGLCVTAVAAGLLRASAEMSEQRQIRALTEQTRRSVAGHLDEYVRLARAGAALASIAPERALASIAPPGCESGSFGIARRSGPGASPLGSPESGGDSFSIVAVAACGRSAARVVGSELAADPGRRAAIDRARDRGEPTLAPRAGDGREAAPSSSLVIYAPFYASSASSGAVADRRAALAGFVYAELDADELFHAPLAARATMRAVDVALYQGEATAEGASPPEGALLVRAPDTSAGEARPASGARLASAAHIEVAGSPLTLVLQTQPAFHESAQGGLVPLIILTGMLLSGLLSFAVRAEISARIETECRESGLRALQRALEDSEARTLRLGLAESEARRSAEAATRLRDEFLATLSHELRTPLTAVMGWVRMLRGGSVGREALDRGLEVIERNARLEAQLIEDLLDITAILGGELRLNPEPTEIAPVIAASAVAIEPYARENGVQLSIDASACEGRVSGDAGRLRQVFWHLLHNAVRFTPRGGKVSVTASRSSGELEITVADTGKGIAPAFLPFVFDRFRQADGSRTRSHGGLGLGLTLVRHIIELHGGTVTAESPGEGRGARFTVTLPRIQLSGRRVVVDDGGSSEASPP